MCRQSVLSSEACETYADLARIRMERYRGVTARGSKQ